MSVEAPNWYVEKFIATVTNRFQQKGFMLRGMAMDAGKIEGNTVSWPIAGSIEAMPMVRGSIVPFSSGEMSDVVATMQDWQTATLVNATDITKMTANEQSMTADRAMKALGRRSDLILLGAIQAATPGTSLSDGATSLATGSGFTLPLALEAIKSLQALDVDIETEDVFCGLPSTAWNQFMSYKQVADAQYVGYDNLPYKQGKQFILWNGVKWFRLPEKYAYLVPGAPWQQQCWMWHRNSVGIGTNYNIQAKVTFENLYTGYLHNTWLGATAAVLQPNGIVRFTVNPQSPIILN